MKENDGWLTRESANQIRMLAKQLYDRLGLAGPEPPQQPAPVTSPTNTVRALSPSPQTASMSDQEFRFEEEEDPFVEGGFDFTQRDRPKEPVGEPKRRAGPQGEGSARKRGTGSKTGPVLLAASDFVSDRVEELMRQLESGRGNAGTGEEGEEGKEDDDADDFELLEE